VVLPRLKNDIVEIFNAIIDENLAAIDIKWEAFAAVCVIMASGGYPGEYRTGYEISGIKEAERDSNIVVFHGGTKRENDKYYTSGGRVLGVTAVESSFDLAIKKAYEGVGKISFKDAHYRKDIGTK